jgi:hypothetical protein
MKKVGVAFGNVSTTKFNSQQDLVNLIEKYDDVSLRELQNLEEHLMNYKCREGFER